MGSSLVDIVVRGKNRVGQLALAAGTALLLTIGGLTAGGAAYADTAPVDPDVPQTVSADSLPTAQINGIVWDQAIIGNTVYAAGEFTAARPAGSAVGVNEVARYNIMSYDIRTGVMTSFAPNVNGTINSVEAAPDGSRIYIGGTFTKVNNITRNRIAALDPTTGAVITSFNPNANAVVRGIAVTSSTVYFTGNFLQVGGNDRMRAAAVTTDGTLLPWAPQLNNRGNAITTTSDGSKVVLGGVFDQLDGSSNPGYGLGMVDGTTGALMASSVNNVVRDAGENAAILSLKTVGDSFYGSGFVFGGGGNLEGIFRADWATGSLTWVEDCHGDTYDVQPIGDVVYGAGHPHYCGSLESGFPQSDPWTFRRGVAFTNSVNRITPFGLNLGYFDFGGNPAPDLLNWFPDFNTGTVSGATQGPWSITGNAQYVSYGGEFTQVNQKGQQGLTRFAVRSLAPNVQGPRNANGTPTLVAMGSGTVRVSWPLAWDRDNEYLKYDLIRDEKNNAPIWTTTVKSKSPDWGLPPVVYTDRGLADGSTHTYKVRTTDPLGNVAWGTPASVTVSGAASLGAYGTAVLHDNPVSYWPLNDTTGVSYDWAGASDLSVGNVTRGVAGALIGDSTTAMSFTGGSDSFASTTTAIQGPQTFALEAWVKTTSTTGGKIVGFGNSSTGNSSSYDRHLYMDAAGHVNFGVYPGTSRVVTSATSYNDGQWHQIVGNLGPDGMSLYVDGKKVGSRTDTTSAQAYTGYWRIGGDVSWSGDPYLNGSIDEVSVYGAPLSRDSILAHYAASGRTANVPTAPTDAYGKAVYNEQPDLFWRLSEATGTTAVDASGQDSNGTYFGATTQGAAGALAGQTNTAVAFNGGSVISTKAYNNPTTYSLEAWVKTTSQIGGKIIGFGNSSSGDSSAYDRHIFMLDGGKLRFGVWIGSESTIDSTTTVNDGNWHYVLATQSPDGQKLYVDGVLQASNTQASAQDYVGYWHVGRDVTWGGSSSYAFNGTIDEVAVYSSELTAGDVSQHYSLGTTGVPANALPQADFTSTVAKQLVSVNGAGSTDSDGTIASYGWNWGDGTPDSDQPQATHTYATAGDHTVTLTVTDNRGGIGTIAKTVTTVANVPPTVSFTVAKSDLSVTTTATAADSDGTVASYVWNWGDGTEAPGTASGSHTYGAAGTFTITLTVKDDDGATTTTSQQVIVTTPPPNVPPTAVFTADPTDLTVAVNAGGSTDSDGQITSYSWNWGDGTPDGTGVTASHNYATASTYTITLTVKDDDNATTTQTHAVTVTAPVGPTTYATDAFGRTASNGFGVADSGGSWALVGTASVFSVDGSKARITNTAAGKTYGAYLAGVSSTDTAAMADFVMATRPVGLSAYASVIARRVGTADYRARVVVSTTGAVNLQLQQSGTTLSAIATGITMNPGDALRIKVVATGTSPTTIKAKVWKVGDTEPTTWRLTTTDTTAALQANGSVGVESYLGASVTNLPYVVAFDNFWAGSSVEGTPEPPVNQLPTALFTSTTSNLRVSVNGSASSDPEGPIQSYTWNWGDGTPDGASVTAQHDYATAGDFTVKLTVKDGAGATASTSSSVTVSNPPVNDALATDAFERVVPAGGFGTADLGGAWTVSAPASDSSVDGHAGVFSLPANQTRNAYLTSVSSTDTSLYTQVSVNRPVASTAYMSAIVRRVGTNDYRARIVVAASGAVNIQLQSNGTTLVAAATGLNVADGEVLRFRVEAVGTSPTVLRAKVWKTTVDEPAAWNVQTTDSTAALQAAGHVGLSGFIGAATNVPYKVWFQSLWAGHVAAASPILAG